MNAAAPGDVIAVDGMFDATAVEFWTPDVTLTCATPGSGLRGPSGWMLSVFAPRVTIEGLIIDATAAWAYVAHQGGEPWPDGRIPNAGEIRLQQNTFICGASEYCVVMGGFPEGPPLQGALVVGNRFSATGSRSALQFHEADGAVVAGNAFEGSGGALRGIQVTNQPVRPGRITITGNTLAGSWEDPLSVLGTTGLQVFDNAVTCGRTCLLAIDVPGAVVADNRFESAGSAEGVRLDGWIDAARVERNALHGSGNVGIQVTTQTERPGGVVIERNAIEGTWADALLVLNTRDVQVLGNTVTCGSSSCFFGVDIPQALVADNHFESAGSFSGVQLQGGTDGAHVERNAVIATAPSTGPDFVGGIRVRDGSDLVVADNDVRGPWFNAVSATALADSRLERNKLAGSEGSVSGIRVDDSRNVVVSRNSVTGSWIDGLVLLNTDGVQVRENTVTCGSDECLFGGTVPGTVVAQNRFASAGSATGVQLQGRTDGVRVEANEIVATAPSTVPNLGGIRARDGANVVIVGNVVRGPWANSLALADLADSRIEQNRLDGAGRFGVGLGLGISFRPISMTGNAVQANQITGAVEAGIWARSACSNRFLGNELRGNGGDRGLVFTETTGANTYVGNRNVVIDNGDFDCDGDGAPDANAITGPGLARRGVMLDGLVPAVGPAESKLR